ncbi:stalled ribosome rescue protein Dom34 [Variovorax sp. GrIS 2.14]|jgi:stalled ribosome rescue protein Dom34|uniref:hypothetical protein n=1 Tax=Variovorax sp. GrIS 2.14 TaxID=3071709 RepID=UPI001997BFE8|nr:hypothetical protein [Variovorax sp.]
MSLFHAVVWVDHHTAQVLQFDAAQVLEKQVKAHEHYTRQHGSEVRSEHEFFGAVCDAMQGITEVLIAGSHTAQADFRHYVEKHRPEVAHHIVGWETTGNLTTHELVALARRYFTTHAGMAKPMKS